MFSFGRDRTASANPTAPAAAPLDGTESVLVTQDGKQRSTTTQEIADLGGGGGVGGSSGTWIPVINFDGDAVGVAYNYHVGDYYRVGNLCLINGAISLSSKGVSHGNLRITGLPFPAAAGSGIAAGGGVFMSFIAFAADTPAISIRIADTDNLIPAYKADGAGNTVRVSDADFTDVSQFEFSIVYQTA